MIFLSLLGGAGADENFEVGAGGVRLFCKVQAYSWVFVIVCVCE